MQQIQKKVKDYSRSRFKSLIRIDRKQKEYIRNLKGNYTLAGKLDEIINLHKKRSKGSEQKQREAL